jgi:tetratricopeptide (TPR) repeat protein
MKSLQIKPKVLIEEIFQYEKCGRYDDAMQMLDCIWEDKGSLPNTEGFSRFEAAEIILRSGSLIGLLGHNKQIPNSQERSKNLLTEAHRRFIDIYNVEKIAECENYLALAYWRTGELTEALIWLKQSCARKILGTSYARLHSNIVKSLLYIGDKQYKKILAEIKPLESDFRENGDYYLNGMFASNLGVAYRNLGDFSKALKYFELSRYYHEKSGNRNYLGTVQNNLAQLYKSMGDFINAHQAIDIAADTFIKMGDKTRSGFSLDTKALIYIEEDELVKALQTIEKGVGLLRQGENADYLVETLATKIDILVKLNKISDALLCLSEAIEIARVNISEDKAKKLADNFAKALTVTKAPAIIKIHSEKESENKNIELVLPPELSHYREIQGVWIKNRHLEKSGLKRDSLAIVAEDQIERGDLVAIIKTENQDVSCGFYDKDFGIICLEGIDCEPQLFNEEEIEILGKIIGVAETEKADDNKMWVEPINVSK